ncbi:beta-galactosidase [Nonomuraea sp. NPDC050556]|uniref:beta-galactosidase n=1 Tax=Nonomuraea sp. NPDC050556 TaxID=3364369 RepID=UPI00378C5FE4
MDDEPRLLLCASLFYFRIARGQWRERLRAVRESGYTCVDVYFPWNHHELAPGVWDFAGERDVAAFLEMAHEEGLLVLARPGPYICSEWDGGALPAWLPLTEGVRLRDANGPFLEAVRGWFDRILPILRDAPAVALVQLENELDFFDCADPAGYIAALREMVLAHGIAVPLIACAGQGDLARATGEVDGVVPAANFYPSDSSPAIESIAEVYRGWLAERGFPLLVTETNRAHVTLRRLLSAGATLIGPYLQASGNDFGFTGAVNNWGSPLALLTSDYDFGGYLSPSGVRRSEYGEARLLAGLVDALGPALAAATPAEVKVVADFPLVDGGARALALRGGGTLVALANPGAASGVARVGDVEVRVPAESCPFVLLDWPIPGGGGVESAAAELRLVAPGLLVFTGGGEVVVRVGGERAVVTETTRVGDLRVVLLDRADSMALRGLGDDGELVFDDRGFGGPGDRAEVVRVVGQVGVEGAGAALAGEPRSLGDVPTRPERLGAYRGYSWYAADSAPGEAILLHAAADILSVYADGEYRGTVTPGGGFALLPGRSGTRVEVRAEIWGHPNFDDARLPALRLGSLRGFDAVTSVSAVHELGPWAITGEGIGQAPAPLTGWGGWITAQQPAKARYFAEFRAALDADSWVLRLDGLAAQVEVTVNGVPFGLVNPHDPFVDVTTAVEPGGTATIELALTRWHGAEAGEVTLLEGRRATGWTAAFAEEPELWTASLKGDATALELPVELPPGEVRWIHVEADPLAGRTWTVFCAGADLKLTAFFNGRLVGRLWLPGDTRPVMAGGDADRFTLPEPWFDGAGNRLSLLAEAVHAERPGTLTQIKAGP